MFQHNVFLSFKIAGTLLVTIPRVVRAGPNRADLCSCLARLQTEPSRAAHFSSSEYSERTSSKLRAILTTVSPD
ncbi:hypothetical protein Hanom_Chr15g01348651 [Helianthus anomalus]